MINEYFNPVAYPWKNENDLVQDLTDECIQMCGVDMKYVKRTMLNRDYLFGESPISEFKDVIVIEMEIMNIVEFNGDGDQFSKFGLDFQDQATFRVSQRRFGIEGARLEINKPREGDILWLPTNDSYWEITKVKYDDQFFKIGKNYCWRLECKLFQFSYERMDRDDPDLSKLEDDNVFLLDGCVDSLERTLGIKDGGFADESVKIGDEGDDIKAFDPKDPFACSESCACGPSDNQFNWDVNPFS